MTGIWRFVWLARLPTQCGDTYDLCININIKVYAGKLKRDVSVMITEDAIAI